MRTWFYKNNTRWWKSAWNHPTIATPLLVPVGDHEVETESALVLRVAFGLDPVKLYFAVGVIIDTVGGINKIGTVVTLVDTGFAVYGCRLFDTEFIFDIVAITLVDKKLLYVNIDDVLDGLVWGDIVDFISELFAPDDNEVNEIDELDVTGFVDAVNFTLLLVETFVCLEYEDVGIIVVAWKVVELAVGIAATWVVLKEVVLIVEFVREDDLVAEVIELLVENDVYTVLEGLVRGLNLVEGEVGILSFVFEIVRLVIDEAVEDAVDEAWEGPCGTVPVAFRV